ncbi:hypothetical protein P3T76_004371 [Phytophthora citrophthora]|uniref:Uncharacterized protein n=1 Tax=Phytophthora citrophthora TaxID=4793 RepID=A0AAD9GSU5_9STRA|nr:hypothetical protein P3T76_004371 [Phytophthora citrophthora]
MPRGGEEPYSEWTFTETLTLDDVEIRERQQVDEDGDVCVVPYAYSVQGRETSRITYRELRKVCSYLGVRYYKNRPKDLMTELIAQQKLNGHVPESYRKKRPAENLMEQNQQQKENENVENQTSTEENFPFLIRDKRQRVEADAADDAPSMSTDTNATNAFLQPVSPVESNHQHSPPPTAEPETPTTPTTPTQPQAPQIHVEMSLTDRVDTFNLLRHIRQQIQHVEDELLAHTNDSARSTVGKAQRLSEDLQFYLAERRSLIQQLEHSR